MNCFTAVCLMLVLAIGFASLPASSSVAQDPPATDPAATAASEIQHLTELYDTARRGRFQPGASMAELEAACQAFIDKWTGKVPATTLATARTYRVRCWLTAEKHAEIAVETTELLALQGLSDDDRYKLLFYCGSAAVALEKRDLANDCVEKLKALNPDIASALRRVVAQKWSPIVVGEAPPQWELARINTHGDTATEGTLKLGDLKGKYVLLDFWATWCGPCKSLMQAELEPMHAEWAKDKRFELVSIGTNWSGDTAEKQKAYAISKNYHWTKVYDSTGEVTDAYGVQGIPTLTLIGPDGKVIAHGYAGEVIPKVKEILAKLGEPGSAGPEQTDPQKQPRIEDF